MTWEKTDDRKLSDNSSDKFSRDQVLPRKKNVYGFGKLEINGHLERLMYDDNSNGLFARFVSLINKKFNKIKTYQAIDQKIMGILKKAKGTVPAIFSSHTFYCTYKHS